MNKFLFETTDATKARRILDILADGEGHAVATAAPAPVPPRPQAVASTTPPAAPAAPPAAPAAPPGAISKAELIKRMGSYVSQGLSVAQIRQINTQLCGQPNAQAIPDELLGQALAQYDAAFAAHKGA